MSTDCLFCKIAKRELNTPLVYEDDDIVAFEDINPQAPIHVLIIPRRHIATLNDTTDVDDHLTGRLFLIAKQLATHYAIADDGYRTVLNCNPAGGQAVYHLHVHLLGGRQMHWPPG